MKAIIHGLSSNPNTPSTGGSNGILEDAGEIKRLQAALETSQRDKEELEQKLEQLRREAVMTNGITTSSHARNESEMTATAHNSGTLHRPRGDTIKASFPGKNGRSFDGTTLTNNNDSPEPAEPTTNGNAAGGVFCEMCESADHDTLDCTKLQSNKPGVAVPYSPGKENEHVSNGVSGKAVDEDKWCALCEQDGHLAFDCPQEQY